MSQNAPPSSPRKSEPLVKRSYNLRLTFSALLTGCIVLVIAIGWAFMLGVMVGRGYNPEKQMPQLANLLPADGRPSVKEEAPEESSAKAEVMKPEELRFASTLKGKPGQPSAEPRIKNMQNATAPATVPSRTETAEAPPPARGADAEQPPKKEPLFDFAFQVATFKDEDSVDKLRAKLEGKGLRTRMEKRGKLLRVMVLVRGNAEHSLEVRRQMADMGLGQPILRTKTPVKGR